MGLFMPISTLNLSRLTNLPSFVCTGLGTVRAFSTGVVANVLSKSLGILGLRKIIPLLISRGYGVIAPEMLGYGGTAKPTDVAAYSRLRIGDSLKDLLVTEGLNKVIVLGHDWVSTGRHA